jgi:hypothetical protein
VVALVLDDVVDHLGRDGAALLLMHHAEGMLTKVALPILLPPPVVSTPGRRLSIFCISHWQP